MSDVFFIDWYLQDGFLVRVREHNDDPDLIVIEVFDHDFTEMDSTVAKSDTSSKEIRDIADEIINACWSKIK